MLLENQVCSLELSKRLKELGVKQESLYAYVLSEFGCIDGQSYENKYMLTYCEISNSPYKYSAFTVAELGGILFNKNYDNLEKTGFLEITTEMIYRPTGDFYRVMNNLRENIIDEINEANARAKMLIYLIENKLIEV